MATASENIERFAFGSPVLTDREVRLAGRPTTALVARLLLAPLFLLAGISKLADIPATVGYMQSAGIPYAEPLAIVAALAEILGGLSILTGLLTRVGALGLIVFLIPTTLIFHDFWNLAGPERAMQMVNFLKNLAIMGGLTLLIADGPGRFAFDTKVRRSRVTVD